MATWAGILYLVQATCVHYSSLFGARNDTETKVHTLWKFRHYINQEFPHGFRIQDYMMNINHNDDIKEWFTWFWKLSDQFSSQQRHYVIHVNRGWWRVLRKLRKRPPAFVDPSVRLQLKPAEQAGNTKHLTCDVMIGPRDPMTPSKSPC